MTQARLLADLSAWVVQLAFWSSLAFVAWYSLVAPWWRYPIGRAIVALDSAIALATGPAVAGLIFGAAVVSARFFQWVTVAAFGAIPLITVWRMVIVWRVQRAGVRQDGGPGAVPGGRVAGDAG